MNRLDGIPFEDHVTRGRKTLDELGYQHDGYVVASAGTNQSGSAQILVLDGNHIEILDETGTSVLDAGLREIRGVRPAPGTGIEIYVTQFDGYKSEIRPQRWIHVVEDQDAKFLDEAWLQQSPSMREGIQLNNRPWRQEEYAYYVGRVLTEAASCEVKLASFLMEVERLGKPLTQRPRGQSGSTLVKLLQQVGAISPAAKDLAERYDAWRHWRNFSAHGIRFDEKPGYPTSAVFKMRQSKDDGETIFDVQQQDFRDLARMWHAFYFLDWDATRVLAELQADDGNIDERLRNLQVSNSVSEAERLPPDDTTQQDLTSDAIRRSVSDGPARPRELRQVLRCSFRNL